MPVALLSGAAIRRALPLLFSIGVFIAVSATFRHYILDPSLHSFWDAAAYQSAFKTSLSHGNAYTTDTKMPFVYPPLTLHLGVLAYRVLHGPQLKVAYVCLNFLAILILPLSFSAYIRSRWLSPGLAVLIFTFAPAFVGEGAFYTGNLTNILYAATLAAAITGVRSDRWTVFYVVVVCVSVVKLPMLSFLLLPLLLSEGQLLACTLTLVGVIGMNLATRLYDAYEYAAYVKAVQTQIFVRGDLGSGLFSSFTSITLRHPHLPRSLPYVAYLLMISGILGMLFILRVYKWRTLRRPVKVAAVLLAAMLCNPRLQAYDLDLFIVPTVYLMVELFIDYKHVGIRVGRFAFPLALALLVMVVVAPQKAIYGTSLVAISMLFATAFYERLGHKLGDLALKPSA